MPLDLPAPITDLQGVVDVSFSDQSLCCGRIVLSVPSLSSPHHKNPERGKVLSYLGNVRLVQLSFWTLVRTA